MAGEATAEFAGLPLVSAEVIMHRGVKPDRFTLVTLPVPLLDIGSATLTLRFGSDSVSISDCAPDKAFMRSKRDGGKRRWSLVLLDRRRKWSQATIGGEYNKRLPNGRLDTTTEKTPGELLTLLLDAVGESGFDVSNAPSTVRPRVKWDATRVDEALEHLLEYIGCEICWQTDDTFAVFPLGQGSDLPNTGTQIYPANAVLPGTSPSKIEVIGGPTVYQSKLKLTGIGQETDGTMKLRDNLTYTPAGGWGDEFPFVFPSLSGTEKYAAVSSVWRAFRVTGQAAGGLTVPGCDESIDSVNQYVLSDILLESADDLDGDPYELFAFVEGTWWNYSDVATDATAQYLGTFEIFADARTVLFPQPMFSLGSDATPAEPTLYITTSYRVTTEGGGLVRLSRDRTLSGSGGTLTLERSEIFATIKTSSSGSVNTTSEAEDEAEAYLDIFEAIYVDQPAGVMEYAGIVPISLSGRIVQVSYTWGQGRRCLTQVGVMREFDAYAGGGR